MPVTSVRKDVQALTLTFIADFDAPVERVWQLWQDPRQLERWWGPPTWPATFERHDFTVGGRCAYFMTGPDGTKSHGWWRFTAIDEPHRLEFESGFADADGVPVTTMESAHITVKLEATETGTRMVTVNTFVGSEQLEQVLAMGTEEGMGLAMDQIDDVLTTTVG